jgi:hypothetical protein
MNLFLKMQQYRTRLTLLFLLFLIVGYFGKGNFKAINDIHPEVFIEPVQMPVTSKTPIEFQKDGFSYKLTPLFDYRISGLVIHRMDYNKWYSLSRTDKTFTTDLCIVWGYNIKSGAYKNKSLSIKQDFRFCLYSYWGGEPIKNEQLSNNHLIIRDSDVKKINDSIEVGDQIRIIGKLVNVHADAIGTAGTYEPKVADWTTSTTRSDASGGACEIIYVEKIEILKKGNIVYHAVYDIGKYGIAFVFFWYFWELFRFVFLKKQ